MKQREQHSDPKAESALRRLETQFDLTVQELRGLLGQPDLLDRFAAAGATIDLLERLREWQREAAPPPVTPTVLAVETTQSIQFFRPAVNIVASGGRSGQQPENDLPLVAKKATVLRVYIANVAGVSGTLEWRAVGSAAWSPPLPALNAPFNPPVDPIGSRGSASASLNFRLPASACVGNLEVRLSFDAQPQKSRVLWDLFGHSHVQSGIPQLWTKSTVITLHFQSVNPLGIRLVRMRYEGRGLRLPAPSVADFWRAATMLRRMYPLSEICLWAESERLYDGDFSDITPGAAHAPGTPNGGSTGDWLHILNNLVALENAPSCVAYVMLYPPGALNPASGFIGWGVGITSLVPTDNQSALAHEIGHVLGRPHAPCGNPAGPDAGYLNYGSYPRASIGEFGVDIGTIDIHNPATVSDFMSYCPPFWISPYSYEELMNRLKTCPGLTTCVSSAPVFHHLQIERAVSRRDYLALTIQIYRNGRVRLVPPAFHLPAEPRADWGRETEYFVELRDEGGFPLSARRLWLQDPSLDFHGTLIA